MWLGVAAGERVRRHAARERVEEEAISRILIVEDDSDLASLMTDILLDSGYQALHMADRDAIAHVPLDPSLALVVCSLRPQVDGWHPLDTIRRLRQRTSAPILACTTDGQDGFPTAAELGVDALLTIPFDIDDFVGLVSRFVP